jgi:hypothetical protein
MYMEDLGRWVGRRGKERILRAEEDGNTLHIHI